MPIAFFTRTRTGALVSRLGNDVIGAQRAFSDTFSGVVSNAVTLTLTVAVMIGISWQVTFLALLLVPLFVMPTRRIGATMARLSRESAIHNATMNTQMTERFSAPGATLVKLFGSPSRESAEFAVRAGRVRDIGGGYRLSGGQRQRLTIARLLLGRSRVVVLDEATASLDSSSEAAVQQALSEALAGRVDRHRAPAVHCACR